MKLINFAKKSRKQFARDYHSNTTLFCLYDSYKFAYPKYLKLKLSDILIYKNRKISEFYILAKESAILEDLLEEKIKPKFVKKTILQYSKKIEEIIKILEKKDPSFKDAQKLFVFNSEMIPLERIIFLVPHLVLDHGVKISDKKLVDYCQEERQRTEKFFYSVDSFFKRHKAIVPKYIKGYKKGLQEFIIFNNEFISDKNVIKNFEKILEAKNREIEDKKIIRGFTAYAGKVKGAVKIIVSRKDYGKMKKGDILVAINTNPDYLPIIKKAAAIVADEGGLLCHAAIVSREFKIPCIIGTKIATQVLKDGMVVEVDAEKGIVRILNNKNSSIIRSI